MRILRFLLKMLPFVLVFIIVWGLALVYWRAHDTTPSLAGTLVVLLAVPLVLIGGFYGLKTGIEMAKRRPKSESDANAGEVHADAQAGEADAGDPEDELSIGVLAGGLRMPNGADAAELVAAIKASKTPGLHDSLLDHRGLPAHVASVAAADPNGVETTWDVLEPAQAQALESVHRRALALAAQVQDDLLAQVEAHVAQALDDEGEHVPQTLEAMVLVPDAWPEPTQRAARAWLQQHADQAASDNLRLHVGTQAVADSGAVLAAVDGCRLDLNRRQATLPRLLLACDSGVDEQTVQRWSTSGRLLSSGNDEGLVPGEGAAGLALAWLDPQAGQAEPDMQPPHLHRVVRRAGVADDHAQKGRDAGLDEVLAQAMSHARCEPASVACLVSDADMRASRAVAVARAVDAQLPELDSAADVLSLGIVTGACGCASPLAGLAVAYAQVVEQQTPVVYASVADADSKGASVLAQPVGAMQADPAQAAGTA